MGILILFYKVIFTFLYFSVILSPCLLLLFLSLLYLFISFFCSFLLFLLFISLITILLYYYYNFIIFLLFTLTIPIIRLIQKPYKILNSKNCRFIFFLCMFILKSIFNSPKFANFSALKC